MIVGAVVFENLQYVCLEGESCGVWGCGVWGCGVRNNDLWGCGVWDCDLCGCGVLVRALVCVVYFV